MTADNAIKLFESIKIDYIRNGTIDAQAKEKLIDEMKKFDRNNVFVKKISDVFRKLENLDDGAEDEEIEYNDRSSNRGGDGEEAGNTDNQLEVMVESEQSGSQSVDELKPEADRTEKESRKRKTNIQVAVDVFKMFTFKCIYNTEYD